MQVAHVYSSDVVLPCILHALVRVLVQCVSSKPSKRFEFACRIRPGVSVAKVGGDGFGVAHKRIVTRATVDARANVRIREYRCDNVGKVRLEIRRIDKTPPGAIASRLPLNASALLDVLMAIQPSKRDPWGHSVAAMTLYLSLCPRLFLSSPMAFVNATASHQLTFFTHGVDVGFAGVNY